MKKKFAIVFLSLFLVVSLPFAAHANIVTATGRYLINAVKHVPGAVRVDATNTATGAKHVIKHGVSSADLGKAIGGGIVGFGVATGAGFAFKAITGLALDAVDWVMDPANNQLKWKEKGDGGAGVATGEYLYAPYHVQNDKYGSASAACAIGYKKFYESIGYTGVSAVLTGTTRCYIKHSQGGTDQTIVSSYNPNYDPSVPADGYKKIPLVDLAKKLLEQADAGNAAAQIDIEIHVTNIAQNGDLDIELDNATDITEPENPEEPNPDEPQQCPSGSVKVDDVCVKIPDSDGDDPLFCDSSEFTKKVCDWIDWTQTEHDELEPDAGKVDIKDKSEDLSIDNDRIDFSNQCPAPTPINTSVGGFPVSTELNYQPLCDFFTMLNPFVVGMGGISSALIIAGGARRG